MIRTVWDLPPLPLAICVLAAAAVVALILGKIRLTALRRPVAWIARTVASAEETGGRTLGKGGMVCLRGMSKGASWFDRAVIEKVWNAVAGPFVAVSLLLRASQTGGFQHCVLMIAIWLAVGFIAIEWRTIVRLFF